MNLQVIVLSNAAVLSAVVLLFETDLFSNFIHFSSVSTFYLVLFSFMSLLVHMAVLYKCETGLFTQEMRFTAQTIRFKLLQII